MQTENITYCDPVREARLVSQSKATLRKEPQKLTAELLIELAQDMPDEKRVGAYMLLDSASYHRLLGDHDLCSFMDPVVNHAQLLNGRLGTVLGMEVLTDAYKHPEEKVLIRNRVVVMAGDMSEGRACDLID